MNVFIVALSLYIGNPLIAPELQRQLDTMNDPKREMDLLQFNSTLHFYAGAMDTANALLELYMKASIESGDPGLIIEAKVQKADVQNFYGNYETALSDLKEGIEYFKAHGNMAVASFSLKAQGHLFNDLGNYQLAKESFRAGIQLIGSSDSAHFGLLNRIYCGLTEAYIANGQLDSAVWSAMHAYQYGDKEMDYYGYSRGLLVLGKVYSARNETSMARSTLEQCIEFSSEEKVYLISGQAALALGQLNLRLRDYKEAIKWGRYSLSMGSGPQRPNVVRDAYELLYKTYLESQQSDSAFHYLNKFTLMKDSVINAQKLNQINGILLNQKMEQWQKDLAHKEELAQQRRKYEFAGLGMGLLLFAFFFVLLSNSFVVNERFIQIAGIGLLLVMVQFLHLIFHPWLGKITHHSPVGMLLGFLVLAVVLLPAHHYFEKSSLKILIKKNQKARIQQPKKPSPS